MLTRPLLTAVPLLLVSWSGDASAQQLWERPVVVEVPGTEAPAVRRDIQYSPEAAELNMDVYLPASGASAGKWPTIVFVHGGPLPPNLPVSAKDIEQFRSYGRILSSRGFAVVTFSHRFYGVSDLATAGRDVERAFQYVQDHAAELSVDKNRLCAWLVSAGGLFAAPLLRQPPPYLRCIVMYYGLTDPQFYAQVGMGDPPPPEISRLFRPLDQAPASPAAIPPLLIVRAGKDWPALNAALDAFVGRALAANLPIQIINAPHGPHAFDVLTPGMASAEVIELTFTFLARNLAPR